MNTVEINGTTYDAMHAPEGFCFVQKTWCGLYFMSGCSSKAPCDDFMRQDERNVIWVERKAVVGEPVTLGIFDDIDEALAKEQAA